MNDQDKARAVSGSSAGSTGGSGTVSGAASVSAATSTGASTSGAKMMNKGLAQIDWTPFRTARVWITFAAVTLFLSWAGYQLGDRHGLLLGFFLAMTINGGVLFYVDWRLSGLFPGAELEGSDPWGLLRLTREEAKKLGFRRPPPVHTLALETPNAFSAGLFTKSAQIYLTEGLARRFTSDEVRLVIAYELRKIKDDRTQRATAACSIASFIAMLANAIDSLLLMPFERRRVQLRHAGPITLLTAPLVSFLMRTAVHRRAILATDQAIANTPRLKERWAETLIKLDSYNKTLPLDVNLAEAGLFTVNPLSRHDWCRFASVQPTVKTRVKRLTGRFPL